MSEKGPPFDAREFWERSLSQNFDLRGTGHPALSAAYNERCYRLRGFVLDRLLEQHRVPVAGRNVLDAGCGSGYFVEYFIERGGRVTGVDLTEVSVQRMRERFPQSTFEIGDLGTWRPSRTYDLVSCFDVLFHIVDDAAWERALTNLCDAVAPGGWLVFTEYFPNHTSGQEAEHNRSRGRNAYEVGLIARGLAVMGERPTHHLMNRDLGPLRFFNRIPEAIYRVDLALLAMKLLERDGNNRMVVARRPIIRETSPL